MYIDYLTYLLCTVELIVHWFREVPFNLWCLFGFLFWWYKRLCSSTCSTVAGYASATLGGNWASFAAQWILTLDNLALEQNDSKPCPGSEITYTVQESVTRRSRGRHLRSEDEPIVRHFMLSCWELLYCQYCVTVHSFANREVTSSRRFVSTVQSSLYSSPLFSAATTPSGSDETSRQLPTGWVVHCRGNWDDPTGSVWRMFGCHHAWFGPPVWTS